MRRMLLILLILLMPATAHSENKNLKQVEKQLESEKSREEDLAAEEHQLQKEVKKLQQRLVKSASRVQFQEDELSALEDSLAKLRAETQTKTSRLKDDQEALAELIVALERLARLPPEALLARPDEPIKAARGTMLIRTALPQIETRAQALNKKLAELKVLQIDIKQKLAIEQETRDALKKEETKLAALIQTRRKHLKKTAGQREAQTQQVRKLAREAGNLRELMHKVERQNVAAIIQPGRKPVAIPAFKAKDMRQPVAGILKSRYGQRDELGAKSRGMTFSARAGAPVVSPLAGVVRFAGPFQNFKQILIVEHGDGYHSLIAGLARVDTAVGERVAAGEPVGRVGQTKAETRLYFELRRHGKPIDPAPVLAVNKNKR